MKNCGIYNHILDKVGESIQQEGQEDAVKGMKQSLVYTTPGLLKLIG